MTNRCKSSKAREQHVGNVEESCAAAATTRTRKASDALL